MPLSVMDMQPGDRVVLNCPSSRVMPKREAQFEGIFKSIEDAIQRGETTALVMGESTAAFLSSGKAWARFLFQRVNGPEVNIRHANGSKTELPTYNGATDLIGAFTVEPDGALRDEEGRRITIERRIRMGQG